MFCDIGMILVVGRVHEEREHHSEKMKSRDVRDPREVYKEKDRGQYKERRVKDARKEIEKREKSQRERYAKLNIFIL